jgi:hypothetical protein
MGIIITSDLNCRQEQRALVLNAANGAQPWLPAPQSRLSTAGTAVTVCAAVRLGPLPVYQYGKATPISEISPLIFLYMSRYQGIGLAVRTS